MTDLNLLLKLLNLEDISLCGPPFCVISCVAFSYWTEFPAVSFMLDDINMICEMET